MLENETAMIAVDFLAYGGSFGVQQKLAEFFFSALQDDLTVDCTAFQNGEIGVQRLSKAF